MPVLDPRTEELLEYNITRLIYRVGHPEKPVVGVLSSLPVMGMRAPPFTMPGQPRPPRAAVDRVPGSRRRTTTCARSRRRPTRSTTMSRRW